MATERNEPCPCGSGKKFKRCCIDDPRYSSTKINNGLARKYMCEFALHTFSSTVVMCYPNNLDKVDVSEKNYHIYMVHEIPRLSFVKDSVKIFETHIEVTIQQGVLENVTMHKFEFALLEGNHKEIFTYELLNNKKLIIRDNVGGGIETDVLSMYLELSKQPLKSEVLYVGQSYGKAGERDAIQRLSSHSTLQEILADTMNRDIEVEITITLWEFTPRLISSFDGISKKYLTSEKENVEHLVKVTSAPPLWIDNQIINISEAALINYFKPEYNEKFKNNFPDITHKGYTFYYDYDYNAVTVELDPSCINIDIFSKSKDYSQFRPIKYHLNSEEERRSIFDIDFSTK
ncbi:SEC-C domain-containing protein [Bacillus sp. B1-b2]|uniref:SEC-C domain-containing protein n=1 Tax=Bacillus sp. B1-b2 TaxID=2653201 RepID=UPI001261E077|nr:SEC-C domain-containing protein [Bacillus sp. B1-b2]KAB7664165.1 SEC-C domain-containing protein [Bacillus sp. B1-b2]